MTSPISLLRFSKSIFFLCGIWLIGLGAYFVFARPALLPEDLRYLGLNTIQVETSLPNLASWLRNVFTVMGGFMTGCGVLVIFVSMRAVKQCTAGTGTALGLVGLLAVATMSWTNFKLDSDFKWLLLAPVVVWMTGFVSYVVGRTSSRAIVALQQSNVKAQRR